MNFYPTRLEMLIAIIAMIGLLSYMGSDQIADEAKTADVIASIDVQIKQDQTEHLRTLADLEQRGKYMTSYDKLEQVAAK
jgi:type II secretory pathway pseudopilin PulG